MFIVSANYRDRESSNRWLVRRQEEAIDKAREFSAALLTNVRFIRSSEAEEGFGCDRVAQVKAVVIDQQFASPAAMSEGEVKLRFCQERFRFVTEEGELVKSCASLRLTPEGAMYAVLDSAADTTKS